MQRLDQSIISARVEDAVRLVLAHLQCAVSKLPDPDVARLATFSLPLRGQEAMTNSLVLLLAFEAHTMRVRQFSSNPIASRRKS